MSGERTRHTRLRRAERGRKGGDTGLASAEKRQEALASPVSPPFPAPAPGRRATAQLRVISAIRGQ